MTEIPLLVRLSQTLVFNVARCPRTIVEKSVIGGATNKHRTTDRAAAYDDVSECCYRREKEVEGLFF